LASVVLTSAALVAAGVSLLPGRLWPLEVLASFRVPILAACLVSGACALLLRLRLWAMLGFASASAQLLLSIPLFVDAHPNHSAAGPTERLRVLTMNLEWSNRESEAVLSLIRSLDPDIVALQEVDYWWRRKLDLLSDVYPFQTYDRASTRPGVSVLARGAPSEEEWRPLHGRAALLLAFDDGGHSFRFAVAHAFPPKSAHLYRLRNRQLESLASALASAHARRDDPLIVVGDLNATPWSPVLHDFEARTGLRSARIGQGPLPTWPSWSPLIRVPIDHVYHSESVRTDKLMQVPLPGSDHLGLLADLVLPGEGG
jgi:endonuclease/exonuclease/phosphatase (EEP) superfamily protein YafD